MDHCESVGQDHSLDFRQGLDLRAGGIMLLLCLIWSMQQVALKATAADIAPVLQLAIRSGVGAALVILFMLSRGQDLPFRPAQFRTGAWRPGLVVGLLFAFEFLFVGEGLRHTSASHMVVFLYTAPVFAALGLHMLLPAERLGRLQWVGIGIAFAGIAIAFFGRDGGDSAEPAAATLLGDFLGLLGGLFWGATTVVVRATRLTHRPAAETLLYQLVGAFVILGIASVLLGQTGFNPTPLALTALAFQAIFVSFVSYLVWFWLLRRYLAAPLGIFSFFTPLFGVILGAWLLGEPIERSFVLGALMVVSGITLVSGHGWLRQVVARKLGA